MKIRKGSKKNCSKERDKLRSITVKDYLDERKDSIWKDARNIVKKKKNINAKNRVKIRSEDSLSGQVQLSLFLGFKYASAAVANKRPIAKGKWSHGSLQRRGQQERRDATVYIITFPRPGVSIDRDASRESRLA